MKISRRKVIASGTLLPLSIGSTVSALGTRASDTDVLTPEMFGAKGDGATNDTLAFQRLSRAVNDRGGGTIRMRPVTYVVGIQEGARGSYAYAPQSILLFTNCSKPLTLLGQGAVLRCAPGLRYGTFDIHTGERVQHPMPYMGEGDKGTPYEQMIRVEGCTGGVHIEKLELDGGLQHLRIGGQWGDTGWQIPAIGIYLVDNRCDLSLEDLHLHHHGQDGLMINEKGDGPPAARRVLTGVRSEYNGRQGCSFIGGRDFVFERCSFSHTGRAGLISAPAAGFDVEAENGRQVRNLRFVDCTFEDNCGVGMVADSGDSADVRFERCRFVSGTTWAAWPRKPGFRFRDCAFVGPIVNCHPDLDPDRATQFVRCRFHSPTTALKDVEPGPIANLDDGRNVLFQGCTFAVSGKWALPWSVHAIYEGCTMQSGPIAGYPRGTFRGRNVITGNVDLYGSKNTGTLIINGKSFVGTDK